MLLTRGSLNSLLSLPIAVCLAIYALTRLTASGPSDALKASDPWRYGFPSWYGGPAGHEGDAAALVPLSDLKTLVVASEHVRCQ